jgi:cytochrome b
MTGGDRIVEVVEPSASASVAVRVWDLPTRLFHWVLVVSVLGSFTTGYLGGNAMTWHLRFGYLAFSLLLFRLLWGFCGGHWSRFRNFAYAPATSMRYLRGQSRPEEHHDVGHNPIGALSVFALLAFLAAQIATGLFADDEIATTGPLNRFVTGHTASLLTHWHKDFGQRVIMVLVLHVGAVQAYLVRCPQPSCRMNGDKRRAGVRRRRLDPVAWLALVNARRERAVVGRHPRRLNSSAARFEIRHPPRCPGIVYARPWPRPVGDDPQLHVAGRLNVAAGVMEPVQLKFATCCRRTWEGYPHIL